jgi:phosphatidylglycerol:prolipoprotein diacylglycerol transferase
MVFYALVLGFVCSHLVDVLFYQPGWWDKDPLLPLKVWAGISSYGGYLGGVLGVLFYTYVRSGRNQLPPDEPGRLAHRFPVAYADALAYGCIGGWMFGRLACAIAHDHIGLASTFVLAVDFPAGAIKDLPAGSYHDLGLYEFLYLTCVFGVFTWLLRRPRREGLLLGLFAVAYTLPRFFFEFLRLPTTDPRYAGLTAAQWFSVAGLCAGIYFLRRAVKKAPPAPKSYRAYDVHLGEAHAAGPGSNDE